ncbi:MAG TPA: CHAD domain-containing protein [Acidobacteriaceae bacterium]|nr:CHAD domain-containing protein [Acidobacteriaceae bacterium]
MASAAQSTRPVEALRYAIQSLEAAALVCLASPKKKPVHHLRTWTRRIQAQLELIALLPDAPNSPEQQANVLDLLKKLRHAAGRVRDLDVERDLVAGEFARLKGSSRTAIALRKEARTLRKILKKQRDEEADALLSHLKKQRKKLPLALKDLCDTFAPMKETALTEAQLSDLIRDWYMRCNPQPAASSDARETLHAIRKRAKHARYMAEIAPKTSTRAHRLAARFEAMQQAGGHWHDWVQLHDVAAKELGKSAPLPQRFAAHGERSLRTYKAKLAKLTFR